MGWRNNYQDLGNKPQTDIFLSWVLSDRVGLVRFGLDISIQPIPLPFGSKKLFKYHLDKKKKNLVSTNVFEIIKKRR